MSTTDQPLSDELLKKVGLKRSQRGEELKPDTTWSESATDTSSGIRSIDPKAAPSNMVGGGRKLRTEGEVAPETWGEYALWKSTKRMGPRDAGCS